jgi:hypothetical protein
MAYPALLTFVTHGEAEEQAPPGMESPPLITFSGGIEDGPWARSGRINHFREA